MRYLGPRIVAQALLWAIKWLRSRPRTHSRRSAKPHASTPPNPTDSPRRRKQPPKLVNKIIKKNNQSPKVIPPNRRSPLRRSEQVMRAPPLSSSPGRTQYARITCEPARKLPRRHYRANTPSAALQNNPRPTPNPTPRCALHRIRIRSSRTHASHRRFHDLHFALRGIELHLVKSSLNAFEFEAAASMFRSAPNMF